MKSNMIIYIFDKNLNTYMNALPECLFLKQQATKVLTIHETFRESLLLRETVLLGFIKCFSSYKIFSPALMLCGKSKVTRSYMSITHTIKIVKHLVIWSKNYKKQ